MSLADELCLSRRVLNILSENGITEVSQLVALNERELLGLRRFGGSALDEVWEALDEAGLELTEDPYAPYICVREGKEARDANLSSFFLCDDCAAQWQRDAFGNEDPQYVGARTGGYCINCNVDRPDVRLRQWLLCGNCDRVARSIGRSVVAERYVLERWDAVIRPQAPELTIESTDEPTLRRGPRGASDAASYESDFVIRSERGKEMFDFEMKTGKSHLSGTAQVGTPMGQFQLDTSDCDAISEIIEKKHVPVYLLHVQVIDRVHPPTIEYVGVAAWWTDVFRMHEHFDRVQRRPRENRNAAYFDISMFEPFASFADHVASGDYTRLAKRLKADGIPNLYWY